jgi:DNA-binding LytR/AlgR family response regulator
MKTIIRKRQKRHEKIISNANENVVRLEAEINYTYFIFKSGRREVMSYTISKYDSLLKDQFIRISRSCIVNKKFIKAINSNNHVLTLKDGNEKQISRRRWPLVSEQLVQL